MKGHRESFFFAVASLVLTFAASPAASAQVAPAISVANCSATVPSYSPDFSSNQACLTLNGEAQGSLSNVYPSFQSPIPPTTPPAPPNVSTVLRLTPNANYWGGSAWFQTPQPVASSFSTTFTFQLSQGTGADGIAFVIQNSGLSALGPTGCGEGFASDFAAADGGCTPIPTNSESQSGITNSIAFRFDSFSQGVGGGTQTNDPGVNNVSIQSCANMAANSITAACQLAVYPFQAVSFADGNVHTATITYLTSANPSQTSCIVNNAPGPCLDVNLDGTDLFPTGVPFSMATLGLTSGNAFVGFTGATGGATDTQDILSWTFTPEAQTQTVQPGTTATYNFQNGQGQTAYSYQVSLNSNSSPTTTTINPILMLPANCDSLVQQTYHGAHCVVYTNLSPNQDSAVMFEVTCPDLPNDQCNPFSADLASEYTLSPSNNFNLTDPFPGWLKGAGPISAEPCTPPAPGSGSLFQSNQVSAFSIDTKTTGHSGGTGSCWVATYDQPDEALSAITITSPTNTFYAQNSPVVAKYSCANPTTTQSATNPTGPYLTTASCTQSSGAGSCTSSAAGLTCTGTVNTSTLGPQTFTVTATDTGTNQSSQSVNYTVVAPTNLQILNLGPPGPIATGGYINYVIGVADLGPANADGVVVTDPLPSNTSFVSGSGSNITCTIVNKRLSCTTTPITCSATGNTVTCNVGMLAPLSISSLNGGAMTIKLQVTGQPTTVCGKKSTPCTMNTATVSAINTDTNSNPSSTASTTW